MHRAKWTPTAKRELEEIHDYVGIQRHSQSAAEKLVRDIHEMVNLHASQPDMGTSRPDLGERFRVFSHKSYVVVFRPIATGIEVLRIVDGRRDYPTLFPR